MGDVVYRSEVEIVRHEGPLRSARLPAEAEPVWFGTHGAVAAHYGVDPDVVDPHATTLDYIVAAAAGWLTGTLGGALQARKIPAGGGRLRSRAVGEIELDGKVLVIRRIHVAYTLTVDDGVDTSTVARVMGVYRDACPVYRSISGSIDFTDEIEVVRG